MPLPEVADWRGRRGSVLSLQPFQSAHMICDQGGLMISTALCTMESEPSHAAIPCCSPRSRGAVTGKGDSLFEQLGIKTYWLHCSGKISLGIIFNSPKVFHLIFVNSCVSFRLALLDLPYTSWKHLKSSS